MGSVDALPEVGQFRSLKRRAPGGPSVRKLCGNPLYGDQNIGAVAGNENVLGVQFIPEKSAKGVRELEIFLAV